MNSYDIDGEKLVDPGIEYRLENEFYELIEKRKEYARQWKNSEILERSIMMNSIIEIQIRIMNIFKELLENDFTLSEKMQNFKEYTFPKDLKDDIIFYPEKETDAAQSKLENKKTRLEYKEVEPLLIKLKEKDCNLTDIDKHMMKRGSFKAQRSKFIKNDRLDKKYKSTLQAIFSYDNKRLPLRVFLQLIESPSKYYNNVLLESFIKYCNNKSGQLYDQCKGHKIVKFNKVRNVETSEIEKHIGLEPRNIK